MLEEGSPNHFQFETHNAAYPARMDFSVQAVLTAADGQAALLAACPGASPPTR